MATATGEGAPRPIEEMSFKEASVELEQIVRSLESGDLELEDALSAYERGSALLRALRERLAEADQKVRVLLDENDAQRAVLPDASAAPSAAFLDEE